MVRWVCWGKKRQMERRGPAKRGFDRSGLVGAGWAAEGPGAAHAVGGCESPERRATARCTSPKRSPGSSEPSASLPCPIPLLTATNIPQLEDR